MDEYYFPILVEQLGRRNFKGHFKSHHLRLNGLATFYNTKKFKLEKAMSYGFNEILSKMYNLSQFKNSNFYNQRIVQFTMLTSLKTGKPLVVGMLK